MAFDLYVITDTEIAGGLSHREIARRALAGGADVIQLRDKRLPGRDLVEVAYEIREITAASGALFIVNDRIDIALAAGADGVHLGQHDLPVRYARKVAPDGFIIGISAGGVAEARSAESAGADYIALSPLFPTSSKPDAGPGCGLQTLRELRAAVSLPVVAIGGIGLENVTEVIFSGADGVAVISSVVGQEDITRAARVLKERIACAKAGYGLSRDRGAGSSGG